MALSKFERMNDVKSCLIHDHDIRPHYISANFIPYHTTLYNRLALYPEAPHHHVLL